MSTPKEGLWEETEQRDVVGFITRGRKLLGDVVEIIRVEQKTTLPGQCGLLYLYAMQFLAGM